jgi:hypothetical protein
VDYTRAWHRFSLGRAWLPEGRGNPPPKLPIPDHDVRRLLSRGEAAQDILVQHGLSEFGAAYSGWPMLRQTGPLVADAGAAQAEPRTRDTRLIGSIGAQGRRPSRGPGEFDGSRAQISKVDERDWEAVRQCPLLFFCL